MISFKQSGNFKGIESMIASSSNKRYLDILKRYAQDGVNALSSATPRDSGETANAWTYEIVSQKGGYKIEWKNGNVVDGVPVAILIQYGHATKNGGFVSGVDFVNPAMKPIFQKIADAAWKEVIG